MTAPAIDPSSDNTSAEGALAGDVSSGTPSPLEHQPRNPLHGVTLEAIEFSDPQIHVAVLENAQGDEEVVGFVGFDRSRDPKTPATTGEIWAVYIKPEHWGKGVGVMLWDSAREGLEEEGCTSVTVWLPLRNDRALRFHELAGFKREMKTAKTSQIGVVKIEEIRLKRSVS